MLKVHTDVNNSIVIPVMCALIKVKLLKSLKPYLFKSKFYNAVLADNLICHYR